MALKIQKFAIWKLAPKQRGGVQLTLERGEIHRLKPLPQGIRVISGCAWVAWRGQDLILKEGEILLFSHGGNDPIISAEGKTALVFEMLP